MHCSLGVENLGDGHPWGTPWPTRAGLDIPWLTQADLHPHDDPVQSNLLSVYIDINEARNAARNRQRVTARTDSNNLSVTVASSMLGMFEPVDIRMPIAGEGMNTWQRAAAQPVRWPAARLL